MFQIEDIIRTNHLNLQELEKNIISGYRVTAGQPGQIKEWYRKLIEQMQKDDVIISGHISSLKETMYKINDLHIELLNKPEEERYIEHYQWAKPIIKELKEKMNDPSLTEIEVCLNGLYGFMLLRIQGKEITSETSEAITIFTQMLRYLSKKYHENNAQQPTDQN
jgi:flagellin-specific chaperone FliS